MAVKKGTDFLLYSDGNEIASSTSCSISLAMDTIDASNKGSSEWAEFLAGRRSGTASVDGMVALTDSYGPEYLFGLMENQTSVTVRFSTETSSEAYWQASAYITSLDITAADNESTTYSASFQLSGKIDVVDLT